MVWNDFDVFFLSSLFFFQALCFWKEELSHVILSIIWKGRGGRLSNLLGVRLLIDGFAAIF